MRKKASILALLLLGAHLDLTASCRPRPGRVRRPGGSAAVSSGRSSPTRARSCRQAASATCSRRSSASRRPVSLLLAACALLGLARAGVVVPRARRRPARSRSIVLQVVWISGWAFLPIAIDAALLWMVFGLHLTAGSRRGRASVSAERAQ